MKAGAVVLAATGTIQPGPAAAEEANPAGPAQSRAATMTITTDGTARRNACIPPSSATAGRRAPKSLHESWAGCRDR